MRYRLLQVAAALCALLLLAGGAGAQPTSSSATLLLPTITPIIGGTSGRLLYDNAGKLGEMILGAGLTNSSGTLIATGIASCANPTVLVGLSAVNGSASTCMRSDAAPALDQSIAPTWTNPHIWTSAGTTTTTSTVNALGTAGTGNITVANSTGWPSTGTLAIDNEFMAYTVVDGTTLSITARGVYGSTAATHANGKTIAYFRSVWAASTSTLPDLLALSNGTVLANLKEFASNSPSFGLFADRLGLAGNAAYISGGSHYLQYANTASFQIFVNSSGTFMFRNNGATDYGLAIFNDGSSLTPARALHVRNRSSTNTNAVLYVQRLEATTTQTAAVGSGPGLEFFAQDAGATSRNAVNLYAALTTATAGAISAKFAVQTASAGTLADAFSVGGDGTIRIEQGLTVASTLPVAGSRGKLAVVTDGAGAQAWGATISGGGSTPYLIWDNGTNWTVVGK